MEDKEEEATQYEAIAEFVFSCTNVIFVTSLTNKNEGFVLVMLSSTCSV